MVIIQQSRQDCMDQFCVLRNHDVKFGENWITIDPMGNMEPPLEIHVYSYKWLNNISTMIKFGMSACFLT